MATIQEATINGISIRLSEMKKIQDEGSDETNVYYMAFIERPDGTLELESLGTNKSKALSEYSSIVSSVLTRDIVKLQNE